MKQLAKKLKLLKDIGVTGIKQSFEDEGVLLGDVVKMRRLCDIVNIKLSVKIGGCEAITDLNNCLNFGADSIVAPMIESEFGLQKYAESINSNATKEQKEEINFYINIESKQAYNNLNYILQSPSSKILSGIVVGRSDLTKSFGYGKQNVDSTEMNNIVKTILKDAKSLNLTTIIGGNIGKTSIKFINELYNLMLLDYIETRNVILKLNENNVKILQSTIKDILHFESDWLVHKHLYYLKFSKNYLTRSEEILNRIL